MQELEYSQPVVRHFFPIIIFFFASYVSMAESPAAAPSPPVAPSPVAQPTPTPPPPKSVVWCVADQSSITDYTENPQIVRRMVNEVVMADTNTNDVASAWRSLVKPGDKIGIKISAAGGKYFSTHKSVVEAIVEGLESAGILRKDIIVWDRDGLAQAGYSGRPGGYQVRSIEPVQGYDSKAVISSVAAGKLIWGDVDFRKRDPKLNPLTPMDRDQISTDSYLCKILSHDVTKIINVPVFSSSESCGVAGALYNVTVPNVDNWRRFAGSDSFICDLYSDPGIGPKVVINIMDGLLAQYAGGPEFQPNYALKHGMVYASKDPVAIDAVALGEIEHWRAEAKLPRVAPFAAYLLTADSMGIGTALPDRIELRMLQQH